MTTLPQEFAGRAIITWPQPVSSALHGADIAVTDADTGEAIVSALGCTVHISLVDVVIAEMTMLCNADGQPLKPGEPVRYVDGTDELLTGTFRWLVAEMRTVEGT